MSKLSKQSLIIAAIQGVLMLVVAVVVSGLLVFPHFQAEGKVSPFIYIMLIASLGFWVGIIAAIGGINTMRKEYWEGKIELNDSDKAKLSKARAPIRPLWLVPIFYTTIQLGVFLGLAALIAYIVFPDGISRPGLVALSGLILGIHCWIAAFIHSRRELLKYIAHPMKQPTSFASNLLIEHLPGNFIANLVINGLLAYVMYRPRGTGTGGADFETLVIDLLITCAAIAILVPAGTTMQAANEAVEKRALPPGKPAAPSPLLRNLAYVGLNLALAAVTIVVIYLLDMQTFSMAQVMGIKGFLAGVAGMIAAAAAAYWGGAGALAGKAHS